MMAEHEEQAEIKAFPYTQHLREISGMPASGGRMMADKQWFQTVGVPGGEYAVKADHWSDACKRLEPGYLGVIDADSSTPCVSSELVYIRPCPPDLVEWIEAEMLDYDSTHDGYAHGFGRMKVSGGWLYETHGVQNLNPPEEYPNYNVTTHAMQFVPVASAAGLTVLEATE